jgi:hypothetical protein
MIFAMLFVMYFVTFVCYFALGMFVRNIFREQETFVTVMCAIGTSLFLIASIGMTLLSVAGTITAVENGFYL